MVGSDLGCVDDGVVIADGGTIRYAGAAGSARTCPTPKRSIASAAGLRRA
jgi:hypothetical protein